MSLSISVMGTLLPRKPASTGNLRAHFSLRFNLPYFITVSKGPKFLADVDSYSILLPYSGT
jgi:hypothetical protein